MSNEKLTSNASLVSKRWRVARGSPEERFMEGIVADIDGHGGALVACTIAKVNHHLAEADAIEQRIAACHNACLGMDDPERAIAHLRTQLKQVHATDYARQTACYTHGQEMSAKDKEIASLQQTVALLTEAVASATIVLDKLKDCTRITPPGGNTVADQLSRTRYLNVPGSLFTDFCERYYCLPRDLFGKIILAAAKQWEASHKAQENKP